MRNIFTEHPKAVGESYFLHFWFALITGIKLMLWGFIAIVHAFFPFMFKTYVSGKIKELHHRITQDR